MSKYQDNLRTAIASPLAANTLETAMFLIITLVPLLTILISVSEDHLWYQANNSQSKSNEFRPRILSDDTRVASNFYLICRLCNCTIENNNLLSRPCYSSCELSICRDSRCRSASTPSCTSILRGVTFDFSQQDNSCKLWDAIPVPTYTIVLANGWEIYM